MEKFVEAGARVAIAGATGAVGRAMLDTLQRLSFPMASLRLMASPRSAGTTLETPFGDIVVENLAEASFEDVDIALFSAGGSVSLDQAPRAARQGAVVIDNSSAFRMHDDVLLVVPEVNGHLVTGEPGIIANPNCSTIQLVVALAPIAAAVGLESARVATYQAASGAGMKGVRELDEHTRASLAGEPATEARVHARPLAFNCVPWIGALADDGYTNEELKMVNESRKILGDPELLVSATCVRVPVANVHSEVTHLVTKEPLTADGCKSLLRDAAGVVVVDAHDPPDFPHPTMANGALETYVGRIRVDPTHPNGLVMWIVSDNLLKGAALNAVQIAELVWEQRTTNV